MNDRAMIERRLVQAEGHVALGERHIARQIEIIAELERDGHDDAAQTARDLLKTFELTQRTRVGDRNWLRARLTAM